jgi:hypothetical protein
MSTEQTKQAAAAGGKAADFSTRVAVWIALMSVVSALAGWRASLVELEASDLERQLVQDRMRVEARELRLDTEVYRDQSLFARYQEHIKAAQVLEDDWKKLLSRPAGAPGTPDPKVLQLAGSLDMEAQGELELARSLVPFFRVVNPDFTDTPGIVEYDAAGVLRLRHASDTVLRTTHPEQTERRIDGLHRRTWSLYGVAAVFVMSVFLLTLAEFGPVSARVLLARAAGLVIVAGAAAWVLTEAALR